MIAHVPVGRLAAAMVAAALVQYAVLSQLRIVGVGPDVFVLLAVLGGLVGGRQTGAATGFAAGITADLLVQGQPFGLSTLVLTVVGYLAGWYASASVDHSTRGDILVAGAGTALTMIGYVVVARFAADTVLLSGRFLPAIGITMLWSMALAVPVRGLVRWVWRDDRPATAWAR